MTAAERGPLSQPRAQVDYRLFYRIYLLEYGCKTSAADTVLLLRKQGAGINRKPQGGAA